MSGGLDARRARIAALGPWFHNIELHGVMTAPEHPLGDFPRKVWQHFSQLVPQDLTGRSVLDIGCNGGFYALEMKRRGAGRVVAIDTDELYLNQARFAAEVTGHDIEFRNLDVYQVAKLGERFDLVIFMGVFYHLRHPLLALDLIHEHAAGDLMLFQSMQRGSAEVADIAPDYPFQETAIFDQAGWPKLHFIEKSYSNDWTNFFVPNTAASLALLRASGFDIVSHPEEEVYLCRRREQDPNFGPYAEYPASRPG
jgi:tRNA (mo5U34)-methyltransferase